MVMKEDPRILKKILFIDISSSKDSHFQKVPYLQEQENQKDI